VGRLRDADVVAVDRLGCSVLGTGTAVFDLLVTDTSGDTGLPPLLGWVGVLPCLAGLLAVLLLCRRPDRTWV
jgi:hypothetical protein